MVGLGSPPISPPGRKGKVRRGSCPIRSSAPPRPRSVFSSADCAAHLVASPLRRAHLGAHLRAGASAGRRKRRHRRLPALPPHQPGPPAATMSASAVFILDVKGKVSLGAGSGERTGEAAPSRTPRRPLLAGSEAPESSGGVGTPLPQSLGVPRRIPPPLFTSRVSEARGFSSLSLSLPVRTNGNNRSPHPRRTNTTLCVYTT